ncbi:hypothetical protein KEM56_004770 [Ascosphaera pollenicola]|nr:hypothetical protein KEM56_004770 [Ascosphaera pollenicola]
MSLSGLVTDSSVPHTVLSVIANDTVAVRCADCHNVVAYTENSFVKDNILYYPVKDVVLNEKHICIEDSDSFCCDPREVGWDAVMKRGIDVDAIQTLFCKDCPTSLAAWVTRNHGANGRSTMLAIDSETVYLTNDESTEQRVPFRSYPPHVEHTPGVAQFFFNLAPVPRNWDQSKADALWRHPGIVSDVRNTLSLLRSQHRHFLLESRREKEKTSNTDWKNVSLALTTSIMEVQHERKRITELERENEELKMKISQMSENQIRSDARRITSRDSFLVRRKRGNDAIDGEDEESGTVAEDVTSPCHGRTRESSGVKRICHSNIRRSTTFEPVQSTLKVTAPEQENTDEEAEEQEGTVVTEQAAEEEEEEEDTENVIR